MAAVGARAAVRNPLRQGDAAIALVGITRLRLAMQNDLDALVAAVLSPGERAFLSNAVTMKRKADLLAGRVAAKAACAAVRAGCNLPLSPFDATEVRADAAGVRLCFWPDGTSQHVSIAHSGAFAIAVAAFDDSACGIDLEPVTRHLRIGIDDLFHPLERLQIDRQSDARLCWTLREAWAKLTSRGVAADLDRVATFRAAGAAWLAVPKGSGFSALVAAGENAAISVAVAMRNDARH